MKFRTRKSVAPVAQTFLSAVSPTFLSAVRCFYRSADFSPLQALNNGAGRELSALSIFQRLSGLKSALRDLLLRDSAVLFRRLTLRSATGTAQRVIPTCAFTLVELLVALALMAVIIPVIVEGMQLATLAGEVSQRKALAARIADRVLNQSVITGPTQSPQSGDEQVGDFKFHWQLKDEPWDQLSLLANVDTPNGVNQGVVNQNLIHQLSVDVSYTAQGRNLTVHVSTLYNTTPQ